MRRPLAIDLYAGLGGWTEGLLAEGWRVVGFDIEQHVYGEHRYPAQLVIQDVLTLHGSQFKGADLIVASPPCQAYSYRAMPWKRARELPPPDNSLFEACFRIQREACAAARRHIPLVVENVRGAQKWVGRARWNYGSYYLWGDVPALMPRPIDVRKQNRFVPNKDGHNIILPQVVYREDGALKNPGFRFDGSGRSFQSESVERHVKVPSANGRRTDVGNGARVTSRDCGADRHIKNGKDWFGSGENCSLQRRASSRSSGRKFASAMIAKIPLTLARHVGRTFKPWQRPRLTRSSRRCAGSFNSSIVTPMRAR